MGVSWVLLGLALGAAAIMMALSIYVLLYWSRPSEKWVEVPTRILVVFSLFFLFMLPVVIPIDRANSVTVKQKPPVGINPSAMEKIWLGFTLGAIFLAAFLLPLCNFYIYARGGGETKLRSFTGGLWKAVIIIAGTLGLAVICWFIKDTKSVENKDPEAIPIYEYFVVFATFLGSIIFTLFLSVGLFIHPVSYILHFIKRPHSMNKDELLSFKKTYKQRSHDLLREYDRIYLLMLNEYGFERVSKMIVNNERNALFSRTSLRKERRNYEKVERNLDEMEREYQDILAMNIKETANPLKYFIMLGVGIFFLILSVLWYVQIIAGVGFKYDLVGKAFAAIDNALGFPVISIVLYSGLTLYLLFCFVNGITTLGMKFVFFMKIYPMERNNTPLAGFVFNSMMMCVGALPALLFFIMTMPEYSKDSGVYDLFYKTVANARIFTWWFYNLYWFIVALSPIMLAFWILRIFFQCKRCKIRKRSAREEEEKKRKEKTEGIMSLFSQEKGPKPMTKTNMMMSAAKNMMGLND